MSAKHLAVEALGRPPLPILNLGYATLHKAYPSLALLLTSFNRCHFASCYKLLHDLHCRLYPCNICRFFFSGTYLVQVLQRKC